MKIKQRERERKKNPQQRRQMSPVTHGTPPLKSPSTKSPIPLRRLLADFVCVQQVAEKSWLYRRPRLRHAVYSLSSACRVESSHWASTRQDVSLHEIGVLEFGFKRVSEWSLGLTFHSTSRKCSGDKSWQLLVVKQNKIPKCKLRLLSESCSIKLIADQQEIIRPVYKIIIFIFYSPEAAA